jgi:four helix bundle protein
MGMVRHFRELRVYREAFNAAMRIFELSKDWPKEERYSLTDQIRRSSRSVCEQIAEAWRKRRYIAHFSSKLTDADSEAAETQSWLDFALQCGYMTQSDFNELDVIYENISGGLVTMMANADQWCISQNAVKECESQYESKLGRSMGVCECGSMGVENNKTRSELSHSHTPTPTYSHTPQLPNSPTHAQSTGVSESVSVCVENNKTRSELSHSNTPQLPKTKVLNENSCHR